MKIYQDPLTTFLFFYRSILPSHYLFYILFYGLKVVGVFLVTHNISKHPDSLISIEKSLKEILFFNSSPFSNMNYISICIFLYLLFLIDILGVIFLYLKHKSIVLKNNIETKTKILKLKTPKWLKNATKIFSVFFLVLMLFAQHFLEILIFIVHTTNFSRLDSNGIVVLNNSIRTFINDFHSNLGGFKYVIYAINMVLVCCILVTMYLFIECSSNRYLSIEIGHSEFSKGTIAILLALFLFQGINTANYFIPGSTSYFAFALNIVAICLCILFIVIDYKTSSIMLSINSLLKSLYFILIICVVSGIYEIFLFFFEDKPMTQCSYFVKIAIELSISLIISLLLFKKKQLKALEVLGNSIFNKNKPKGYSNSLFQFALLLYELIIHKKDNLLKLHSIFQRHTFNCRENKDKCPCQYMNIVNIIHSSSKILKQSNISVNNNAKKTIYDYKDTFSFHDHKQTILENFITICEEEIKAYINLLHKSKENEETLQTIITLHCDFLVSIKDSTNQAIYTIQQYMNQNKHKLSFINYFYLYELNRYVIKSMLHLRKTKHHRIKTKETEKTVNQQIKIREVMEYLNGIDQVKQHIIHFCEIFEQLLSSQSQYVPFDIYLQKMTLLKHNINHLFKLISKFPGLTGILQHKETCYLLSKFFLLVYKEIPEPIRGMFIVLRNVKELNETIVIEKNNPSNSMVINMNPQEMFVITYISQHICDELNYEKELLINSDFHSLLPRDIRKGHEKLLQLFINYNNKLIFKYTKETYLLNKNNNIIPLIVSAKKLPTYHKNISLIINASFINNNTSTFSNTNTNNSNSNITNNKSNVNAQDYFMYHFLLDYNYNIFAISSSVESQFMFSLKMFEDLKINFCFFFNISQEKLTPKDIQLKLNQLKPINLFEETEAISIFTNPSLNQINLLKRSRNIIEIIDKDYCFTFNNIIKKDRILYDLNRFTQRINDYGLDNEFQKYISYLADRLKPKKDNPERNPNYEMFQAKYIAKVIGDFKYYVVVLKEVIDNSVKLINNIKENVKFIKYTPNMTHHINSTYSSKYLNHNSLEQNWNNDSLLGNYKKKLNNLNNTNTNSTNAGANANSYFGLPNQNSSNTNASNATMASVSKGGNETKSASSRLCLVSNQNDNLKKLSLSSKQKNNKKGMKHKIVASKIHRDLILAQGNPIQLAIRKYKYSSLLNYCIWFLFITVNTIIISKIIIHSSQLKEEETLLHIITSIVGLQGEVMFASIDQLNNCLYGDGILDTDYYNDLLLYGDSGVQLIEAMNDLTKNIYKLNDHAKTYQLFTKQSEYNAISFDWTERKRVSTLTEEILLLHYYMKIVNQNSDKTDQCRFVKYFVKETIKDINSNEEATIKEQLLYYLIYNTEFQIKTQLESFKISIIEILKEKLTWQKDIILGLDLAILSLNILLFILTVLQLQIFNRQIKQLLNQLSLIEGKEVLEKFKVLKSLLLNFEIKNCAILDKTYTTSFTVSTLRDEGADDITSKVNMIKSNNGSTPSTHSNLPKINNEKEERKANKTQLQAGKIGLYFMIAWIVIVMALVIARMLISFNEYECVKILYTIGRFFIERIPLLCEFVFYVQTSVTVNNPNFIQFDSQAFETFLSNTYYEELMLTNRSSLLSSFAESQLHLYLYQIDLIDQSISKYIYEDDSNDLLSTTKSVEIGLNQNFCISLIKSYSTNTLNKVQSGTKLINVISSIGKNCRLLKINDDSLKLSLRLMVDQTLISYTDFWDSKSENRVKQFFDDTQFATLNIRTVMKVLKYLTAKSITEEFDLFIKTISYESLIWSCVLIIFCFVLIFIILSKFFTYLKIARDILLTQGNFILTALKKEK